jgi:hypothetical protein
LQCLKELFLPFNLLLQYLFTSKKGFLFIKD